MDTIYIVTPSDKDWEGVLAGFAVNTFGIIKILRNHYRECLGMKFTSVQVDLEAATAVVTDDGGDWTYYIRTVKRAACTSST